VYLLGKVIMKIRRCTEVGDLKPDLIAGMVPRKAGPPLSRPCRSAGASAAGSGVELTYFLTCIHDNHVFERLQNKE